ncbi:MAG: DUF192 domain-containing protein [Rhodospirillaceae bacterium]|nr:DUF192 domain-containing protein [Rhodospirillaceae bacterium]
MMFARRFALSALALCAYLLSFDTHAQAFRPHEPLDPAKAQSLPFTPMSITTAKGTVNFQVEVADTDQRRATGLMHRTELAIDKGMLFDMKRTGVVSFWMRNTFIPLDMLFIAPDGTVRSIAENTVPHNDAGVSSKVPVMAVLELKGGAVKAYGIQVGDKITHAIFKK